MGLRIYTLYGVEYIYFMGSNILYRVGNAYILNGVGNTPFCLLHTLLTLGVTGITTLRVTGIISL